MKWDRKPVGDNLYDSKVYHVETMYNYPDFKDDFAGLKANVIDLNQALVVKCIQGTEQDFIMLMEKASDYLSRVQEGSGTNEAKNVVLLDLFRDCVFGYYILTPLILSNEVSDIKILSWDKITCKVNGDRYITDLSFDSEEDYNLWFDRLLRMHRLQRSREHALQHCTDTKGIDNFYLRIDIEMSYITSNGANNVHIRKFPKEKLSWDYLKGQGMLNDEMFEYIRNRIGAGYGFLISGKGGSGKSILLNNMLDLIPYGESVLVSQESDELYSNVHPQMQFEHTIEGVASAGRTDISLDDELRMGLLQDIDNFVIGEIKGGEALYVFTTAMSTGARFFGTIHSNNAAGSVRRLAQCARYVSDYTVEALEGMLSGIPMVLVHMSQFAIDEILEVADWDTGRLCLNYVEIYKRGK